MIVKLIDSFVLELDFKSWWEQNQINSPLLRFSNFLTKILLNEISENIVIFIDEIDSVLSLNFPTDDFFAFIRSCYNSRVDNPEYNRLTFCLLGVASPTSLIQDKQRTPFNIGQAISLKGFQLHEVEPLKKGLQDKFSNPQAIMQSILQWTGGQPFLTPKLCQFMVEESEQDNPRSVEQVVRLRIIESWESRDEPEHLRTIQARILRDQERAAYLLELYHQVRLSEEQLQILADDTSEQSELQLSGLVVRQQGKLRIYNQIYREIFDLNWIETQLNNLRPYSENFRFWVASRGTDESRLLRGKALEEAEEWAQDKNLGYQDRQFLAASKEKEIQEEIAAREIEAQLEREKKDREATEQRNRILAEANRKARQRIRNGTFILVLTVLGAVVSVILAGKEVKEAQQKLKEAQQKLKETYTYVAYPQQLRELAEKLGPNSKEAQLISKKAAIKIKDAQIEQVYLHASKSLAYQYLQNEKLAEESIKQSMSFYRGYKENKEERGSSESNSEFFQTAIFALRIQGDLLRQQKNNQKAIEAYKEASNILQKHSELSLLQSPDSKILDSTDIESIYRSLIELNTQDTKLKEQVEASQTQYFYAMFEYLLKAKNWEAADRETDKLMLNIAKKEEQEYLDYENINSFSCPDLRKINQLWVKNSNNRFGFSVQKEIWISTQNRLGIKPNEWTEKDFKNYIRFSQAVGWYDNTTKQDGSSRGSFVSYDSLIKGIKDNPSRYKGGLPNVKFKVPKYVLIGRDRYYNFLSRVAACKV